MPVLNVSNLSIDFRSRTGPVRVVDGVSFHLERGETLGIVGESGSGKSVSCLSLMRLLSNQATISAGSALLDGEGDLYQLPEKHLRRIRGKRITMVFQDPMTALNPYLRISTQMIEGIMLHENVGKREASERAITSLEEMGVSAARERFHQYPHQFSGGMRQRVMIAMATLTSPDILLADEPTTALDVTVQAQILELLRERQQKLGTAIILVTHDLGIVAGYCDRVVVMYAGMIMEEGSTRDIFARPLHPYTSALRKTLPAEGRGGELFTIPGAPLRPEARPPGCPFAPRCAFAVEKCRQTPVHLATVKDGHPTACLRIQDGELSSEDLR